jgi:hypothetical protein
MPFGLAERHEEDIGAFLLDSLDALTDRGRIADPERGERLIAAVSRMDLERHTGLGVDGTGDPMDPPLQEVGDLAELLEAARVVPKAPKPVGQLIQ